MTSCLTADSPGCSRAASEVRLYRGRRGLGEIADHWRALTDRLTRKRYFHLVEWHQAYWDTLADDPEAGLWAVAFRGEQVEVIVPLMRMSRRVAGLLVPGLSTLRNSHLVLNDLTVGDPEQVVAAMPRVVAMLEQARDLDWHFLELPGLLEDSAALNPQAWPNEYLYRKEPAGTCDYLSIMPFEAQQRRWSKKFRSQLRRGTSQLAALGPTHYERSTTGTELERAFAKFLDVEGSGWKGSDGVGTSIIADRRATAYFLRLMQEFGRRGDCRIDTLYQGDVAIACRFFLRTGDTLYALKTAYREDFARFSPSFLLLQEILKTLGQQEEIRRINLITGVAWHACWRPEAYNVADLWIFRPTWKGRLARRHRQLAYQAFHTFRNVGRHFVRRKRGKLRVRPEIVAMLWPWRRNQRDNVATDSNGQNPANKNRSCGIAPVHPPTVPAPGSRSVLVRPVISRRRKWTINLGMRVAGRAAAGLNRLFGSRAGSAFGILMYHRIWPVVPGVAQPLWNVTPERFAQQIGGLLARGYVAWPLRRVLEHVRRGQPLPPKTFVITFDDIFASVHQHAFPVLQEQGVPATCFISTKYLDGKEPFPFDAWGRAFRRQIPEQSYRPVSTAECREMLGSGLVDFGAHTHTHEDFRGRPDQFQTDLQRSIEAVRPLLGVDNVMFAFPYGSGHQGFSGEALMNAARQTDTVCALTTDMKLNLPESDPFGWGRIEVFPWDTAATLSGKLQGWYGWAPALWRSVAKTARLATYRPISSRGNGPRAASPQNTDYPAIKT